MYFSKCISQNVFLGQANADEGAGWQRAKSVMADHIQSLSLAHREYKGEITHYIIYIVQYKFCIKNKNMHKKANKYKYKKESKGGR